MNDTDDLRAELAQARAWARAWKAAATAWRGAAASYDHNVGDALAQRDGERRQREAAEARAAALWAALDASKAAHSAQLAAAEQQRDAAQARAAALEKALWWYYVDDIRSVDYGIIESVDKRPAAAALGVSPTTAPAAPPAHAQEHEAAAVDREALAANLDEMRESLVTRMRLHDKHQPGKPFEFTHLQVEMMAGLFEEARAVLAAPPQGTDCPHAHQTEAGGVIACDDCDTILWTRTDEGYEQSPAREVHKVNIIGPDLYAEIIRTWGTDAQKRMVFEECGELIAALAQHERGRDANVTGEIADVLIVLDQLRQMFDAQAVDMMIDLKLDRIRERLARDGASLPPAREGQGQGAEGEGDDDAQAR